MTEPTLKLPRAAETLLADFPMTEPDYEAQATTIEARLAAAPAPGANDDLLKAPDLAPEQSEAAATRAGSLPKSHFAEMARRSVLRKDDDAARLTKELLAATAHARRPSAEVVERVRAAGRAAATPLPVDSGEESARPSGVVSRAEAHAPRPPEPIHRGTLIGVAGTLVALAACVALFLKPSPVESPSAAAAAATAAQAEVSTSRRSSEAKPSDVVSPEALARAQASPEGSLALPKPAGGAARPVAEAKASAAPASVPPVELRDDPEPPRPVASSAKAEPEPPLKPAEGSTGSVPLTPSAGAVSIALGAVRGGAQACLAGQADSVSATVTFAADGHVVRVSAPGPAGACIQAALTKARIAPFARETFSARTTVRPP